MLRLLLLHRERGNCQVDRVTIGTAWARAPLVGWRPLARSTSKTKHLPRYHSFRCYPFGRQLAGVSPFYTRPDFG